MPTKKDDEKKGFDFNALATALQSVGGAGGSGAVSGDFGSKISQLRAREGSAVTSGAAQGAGLGATILKGTAIGGPAGAAIGAGVGVVGGLLGANKAKKERQKQTTLRLGEIEKDKQDKTQNILGSLIGNLRSIL